jgi:hypothetical protein
MIVDFVIVPGFLRDKPPKSEIRARLQTILNFTIADLCLFSCTRMFRQYCTVSQTNPIDNSNEVKGICIEG